MGDFYIVDEYSGELPNPRLFPVEGKHIVAIEGYPHAFADGYIMDLVIRGKDKERLEKLVTRTVSQPIIDGLIELAKNKAAILLSEPKYIHDGICLSYVLLAPKIKPVGMQVKYYNYFRNRYPGCGFYTDGELLTIKSVKHEGELVGLWMAIAIPMEE